MGRVFSALEMDIKCRFRQIRSLGHGGWQFVSLRGHGKSEMKQRQTQILIERTGWRVALGVMSTQNL